jgi:hypothetical protein
MGYKDLGNTFEKYFFSSMCPYITNELSDEDVINGDVHVGCVVALRTTKPPQLRSLSYSIS